MDGPVAVDREQFSYDDAVVRKFLFATIIWGIVGMLVGVLIALQLTLPTFMNFEETALAEYLNFGRLRPLHTNAVIFAFTGNAIFCGVYYSTQRLLKARMFSDFLSNLHFWGWQAIIVAAAITLPLGITQSREYAELEWPIDIAIAGIWVVFAINFFGTIAKRRERHLYVAIWFYIATVVTIALLHIFNNIIVPAGLFKSYSVYAGVEDAFMQWWYGHNAVGFLLTTPLLGLMYYYLPKAANRPVFSYKLSILHFWSLIFIYIWAGPHHLHYTATPAWASTLGMLFSIMLWMPSWGGMLNGLLTLRGAWNKVAQDPILKFFVVSITFYGMSTFEGPLLSVKIVNKLSHYTDWTIAHVHSGALGWVGFITFGMIYWLTPRIFQTKMWSDKIPEYHFWIGTIGILLYIIPIYVAGITQGLMWFDITDEGGLAYSFVETTEKLMVFYWVRTLGGLLYLTGTILCGVNILMTWLARPKTYEVPTYSAPSLSREYSGDPVTTSPLRESGAPVVSLAYKIERLVMGQWHRKWERLPLFFTIMVVITVAAATLFEAVPAFLVQDRYPKGFKDAEKAGKPMTDIAASPYTPLELMGRDVYVTNGCYNCHSQMIRPIWAETMRYGDYSLASEFIYDHPFQWGSRRIGPDLAREGVLNPDPLWHVQHFENPRQVVAKSIMPAYAWMLERELDFEDVVPTMKALQVIGVPYSAEDLDGAVANAKSQAKAIADDIVAKGGQAGYDDKVVVAVIAYLQHLGTERDRPAQESVSTLWPERDVTDPNAIPESATAKSDEVDAETPVTTEATATVGERGRR